MTVGITDQYLVLVAVTLVFTVIALLETDLNVKSIILEIFAALTWFLLGFAQILSGDQTSALTFGLTYLWVGFGFVFISVAIYNMINLAQIRKKQQQI